VIPAIAVTTVIVRQDTTALVAEGWLANAEVNGGNPGITRVGVQGRKPMANQYLKSGGEDMIPAVTAYVAVAQDNVDIVAGKI